MRGVAALHLTRQSGRGTVSSNLAVGRTMRGFGLRSVFFAAFALLALAFAGVGTQAQAANPLELNFWLSGPRYDGALPPCEAGLSQIQSKFSSKEGNYWNSALEITNFADVREIAFRPWQSDNIPRRYCTAIAYISDGKPRPVNYSLIEDGGLAGYGFGVEWCVVGLDRNWAYNPACRAARP